MTLQKAEKRLEEVHNPIAYTLYQVWKEADRSGGRKTKDE